MSYAGVTNDDLCINFKGSNHLGLFGFHEIAIQPDKV